MGAPEKYDPSKIKMTFGGKECGPMTVEMQAVTIYAVKCIVEGETCYVAGLLESGPDETKVAFTRYSGEAWRTESEACAALTAKGLAGHSSEVVKGSVRRVAPGQLGGLFHDTA